MVTVANEGTTDQQLTLDAIPDRAQGVVDDKCPDARERRTDGNGRAVGRLHVMGEGPDRTLRRAVDVRHDTHTDRLELMDESRRKRLAADEDLLEGAQAATIRGVGQHQHRTRRRALQMRHAVAFEQRAERIAEARPRRVRCQHDRVTFRQRPQELGERCVEGQRRVEEEPRSARSLRHVGYGTPRVEDERQVGVGDPHALRTSGRPGGVDDVGQRFR